MGECLRRFESHCTARLGRLDYNHPLRGYPSHFSCRMPLPSPAPDPLLELPCHTQTPDAFAVSAGAAWVPGGGLRFTFRLDGDLKRLRLPLPASTARRDGLWRHTCCEAFLALPGEPAYREFNFSPSGEWAAYAFSAYRQPLPDDFMPEASPPSIRVGHDAAGLCLEALLAPFWLPGTASGADIGLSVVIETVDGALSCRALRHVAPQPDFHQRESFALFLPPTPFCHENRT